MRLSVFRNTILISRRCSRFVSSFGFGRPIQKQELEIRRNNLVNKVVQSVECCRHLAIIPAAEIKYKTLHVPFDFRQDSNFRYLTGLVEPNSVLVLDIKHASMSDDSVAFVSRLFVPERDGVARRWDGPTLGIQAASSLTGICETAPLTDLPAYLKSAFSQLSTHSGILWASSPFYGNKMTSINRTTHALVLETLFESQLKDSQLKNPNPLIDDLRLIKSEAEINIMRDAVHVTSQALKNTMASAFVGIREAELAARFEFESKVLGSTLGYPAVVAGGPRANIIHYLQNDKTVKDGELVLMDVGSEVHGYTADITRTWPINGTYTLEQRLLHEILVRVQEDCREAVSPETSLQDVYKVMIKRLSKYLQEERVIPFADGDVSRIGSLVCPHHVGHYLGLDVHDTDSIAYSRKFEPGMVFPLEPGLYFPEEDGAVSVREEFRGLGLRLEDDYFINADGVVEKLADALPFESAEIEVLIGCKNPFEGVKFDARSLR